VNKNLLSLAMSLALLMSAVAQGQTTHFKVTVPFEFVAGNVPLPADEYEVTALGTWGGTALSVHNVHSNAGSVVLRIHACRRRPLPAPSWFSIGTANSISLPKFGTGTALQAAR
jgi:hypothetical protein